MKKRLMLAVAASAMLLSAVAPAESYYVRNRPFKQVVKAGSEALVGTEAFLRALDLNWNTEGNVVTLTDNPAANPPLPSGVLTFRYGKAEAQLESTQRGGNTYVSLRPLAKLTEFNVNVNRQSGTVDIVKARFATDAEKKMNSEYVANQEAASKARDEAWAKKASELKEKREAASKSSEEKNGEEATSEEKPEGQDKTASKPAKSDPASSPSPNPPAGGEAKPAEKEAPKEARLEVFRTDANPNPQDGIVTITCEIKNMGDAKSKPVSGTLTLTGPDSSGNAANNANTKTKVWLQKTISGPAIEAGTNWQFSERYRHPSGSSMPMGNIVAEFKLSSTK